jgi:hypothetical protein
VVSLDRNMILDNTNAMYEVRIRAVLVPMWNSAAILNRQTARLCSVSL